MYVIVQLNQYGVPGLKTRYWRQCQAHLPSLWVNVLSIYTRNKGMLGWWMLGIGQWKEFSAGISKYSSSSKQGEHSVCHSSTNLNQQGKSSLNTVLGIEDKHSWALVVMKCFILILTRNRGMWSWWMDFEKWTEVTKKSGNKGSPTLSSRDVSSSCS